jgi:hypothetical protein
MSQQPQQPGWGPPPPPPKPKTRKAWHETWWIVGPIGFLIGLGVASVGGGSDESGSQATETSIVFRDRDREVFTTWTLPPSARRVRTSRTPSSGNWRNSRRRPPLRPSPSRPPRPLRLQRPSKRGRGRCPARSSPGRMSRTAMGAATGHG